MLFSQKKITSRISWIIFILIAIQIGQTLSAFTDVPRKLNKNLRKEIGYFFVSFVAPPTRPEHFRSREELKRYLQLVCLNFNIFLI